MKSPTFISTNLQATAGTKSLNYIAGFTLLELMIALSLGLLVAAAIGSIYIGSNQTYRVQEDSARIQEIGRYALEVLGRSLRQAGYADLPVTPTSTKTTFTGTPINGTNGAAGVPDTVTIQYDGTGQADCSGAVIAAGSIATEAFDLSKGSLRCNTQPLVGSPPSGGVTTGPEIEDLQFIFGVDTDGDQSANQYTATPGNWNNVVSARVCVLVRSSNQGIATGNQTYLNCEGALGSPGGGAATTTATDTFLRRPFVATFNLRNRINRQP